MHTALTTDGTQELVKDVVGKVVDAVVGTMGPNGKLVFISNGTAVKVTKDGVSVAKSIRFDDPRQELINRVIVEPAIKTDTECGDGTTTTILLMARLYDLFSTCPGFREQRYIEDVVNRIILKLREAAITVTLQDERLFKLALTSSNSDEQLSKIVTDIYAQSGARHPEIELKEGQLPTDKVVRSAGLPIKMHFSNPLFSKMRNGSDTDFTNFYPIIVDGNLGRGGNPIEAISKLGGKYASLTEEPTVILIIGRTIEQDLNTMMHSINEQTKRVRLVGISTDVGGSVGTCLMQDIAAIFDVPLFMNIEDAVDSNLEPVTSLLTVNGTRSILKNIPEKTQQAILARADEIQSELGGYELGDRFSVRAKFNETRIRNLRGELVTVFVGGETYSDVKERIDRFEDVVKAVKSALVNGVLPGIGSALAIAGSQVLNEELVSTNFANSGIDKDRILRALGDICHASYNHLMKQVDLDGDYEKATWVPGLEVKPLPCVNLATGEMGTSEDLGVYDTAFAIVTALRGGLQTAKILANANSLILSDKLSAVMLKQ